MTELDLKAIKARCEAATPGPWDVAIGNFSDDVSVVYVGSPGLKGSDQKRYNLSEDDQKFIAHARADVPTLVAEVERLRAALMKESDRVVELLRRIDGYENLIQKLDWK